MKNFFRVNGIVALAAAIGFAVTACGDGGGGGSGGGSRGGGGNGGGSQAPEIEMVLVTAGTFTRGSNDSEDMGASPTHTVTLTQDFYMGKYEVTQAQWEAVMDSNPSYFHGGSGREPAEGEVQGNRPVENISWFDAIVFCNRLSIAAGLTPAYRINNSTNPDQWGPVPTGTGNATWAAVTIVEGSKGYRLPTEAQWEYACRAGTVTAWSYGNTDDATTHNEYMWYYVNSGGKTRQVGLKKPNAWGLHDMHGNVKEWCWDRYEPYSGGTQTDPVNNVMGSSRVIRGGDIGSIGVNAREARSAFRIYAPWGEKFNNVGFRIVRP